MRACWRRRSPSSSWRALPPRPEGSFARPPELAGEPGGAELAGPTLQRGQELVQLVVLGSQLVDLAKSGGNVGERAGRIGAELGESPLLALEEAAEDECTRLAFLGQLPQFGFRRWPLVDDGA